MTVGRLDLDASIRRIARLWSSGSGVLGARLDLLELGEGGLGILVVRLQLKRLLEIGACQIELAEFQVGNAAVPVRIGGPTLAILRFHASESTKFELAVAFSAHLNRLASLGFGSRADATLAASTVSLWLF